MYDEMYPSGVYAHKANEWLIKAETKLLTENPEVARVRIEGARVYAMLAEVARKKEEEK